MDNKNASDEIDLEFLLRKTSTFFKRIIRSWFNGLNFVFRNWIILLVLVIIGGGLGYFLEKSAKRVQSANVVIRTNFNSAEYTYNALELLLAKSKEKDTVFLMKNGFRGDTLEIKNIEIIPIVNFNDIAERYEPNDQNLEALLKNIEFEEDVEKINTFNSSYKYHTIDMTLSPTAKNEAVDKVINYLNNQELIKEVGRVGKQNLLDQIDRNNRTFIQIDTILDSYSKTQSLASSNSQIYVVDKNFNISQVLELKMELQAQNKKLKEELVYANNTIVKLNSDPVFTEIPGLLGNYFILFPLLFVFLFLFFSWLRHIYFYLKEFSQE